MPATGSNHASETGVSGDANALAAGGLFAVVSGVAVVALYLVTRVGGTILAVLRYRSQLVPRSLAVLALIGYPVLLVGCILDMFDVTDVTKGAGLVAIAPGGLFELILPIWLLAKGFNSSGHALPGKVAPQIVGKR